MRADSEDPESYTPPSFLSLSFPFLMFHSYLGTLLYYSFFFFFSFDYHTFLSIPPLLYISMHPCIVVSPRILVSLYRLDSSFFSFCPPPLVLCIQRSPRVLYSSTSPPYFSIFQPQVQPSLCLSFLYGLPGHPCTYLLPSSLKISRSPYAYTYIFHILHPFSTQSSSYLSRINLIRLAFD